MPSDASKSDHNLPTQEKSDTKSVISRGRLFLSCYLSPTGKASIFGPRHDHSIALWEMTETSVRLLRLWELERVSGQKHHYWPLFSTDRLTALLNELLSEESCSLSSIEKIWGVEGFPQSEEVVAPVGAEKFPIHSLAHLFSGLLMNTAVFRTENFIALASDGAPDTSSSSTNPPFWYAGCASRAGKLTFVPIRSPAPLYSAARALFGKEPGTLMALATACKASVDLDIERDVAKLNLLGGRDAPITIALPFVSSICETVRAKLTSTLLESGFDFEEHVQSATMKIVQKACEQISMENIHQISLATGLKPADSNLSTSGGYALNCPTNSLLMNTFCFKKLQSPPCANDSGQALGIGLLAMYNHGFLEQRDFTLATAYHGAILTDIDAALEINADHIDSVNEFDPDTFVSDVSRQPVAWAMGSAELGPRALGHRSLLGDPRSSSTKDTLNHWKRREWWRPVAPIVIHEQASEWFETDRPSPFMLEVAQVRPSIQERVPAIAHLDGTARHQTLLQKDCPFLYDALSAFHTATGVPILCNTSLNDKGEPIATTALEVINFCIRKGVEVAYLETKRIKFRKELSRTPTGPAKRRPELFLNQEKERDRIWREWLDRGYSEQALSLLSCIPELREAARKSASPEDVNALAAYKIEVDPGFSKYTRYYLSTFGPGSEFRTDRPSGMED